MSGVAEITSESTVGGAMLLGAMQGLTEFLPVSSSGHLALLGADGGDLSFELVVHLGTLVPVLFFYRETLTQMAWAFFRGEGSLWSRPLVQDVLLVALASIPTAFLGLALKDWIGSMPPFLLAVTFAITALFLLAAGRWEQEGRDRRLTPRLALLLGLVQGIAVLPGISRSGSTIAVALLLGVQRERATAFSFLMSIPAILGASLLELSNPVIWTNLEFAPLIAGGLTAMCVGYFALSLLVRLVLHGRFASFHWYLWGIAAISAFVAW